MILLPYMYEPRGIDYNTIPDIAQYGDTVPTGTLTPVPNTYFWWPHDTEDRWNKRFENGKKYANSLWLEEWKESHPTGRNPLKYTINAQGFRADALESYNSDSITFLGCSMTFGIGVHKETTFAHQIQESLGIPTINMSIPGGSLDAAYRVYSYWQPRIKSKMTVVVLPPGRRIEAQMDKENLKKYHSYWQRIGSYNIDSMTNGYIKEFILTGNFQNEGYTINTQKNLNAIKYIASETGSKVIVMDTEHKELLDKRLYKIIARDGAHPGKVWQNKMKELILDEIRRNG